MPFKFGTYTFQQGFAISQADRTPELPYTKLARAHGSVSNSSRKLKERNVTLQGAFSRGLYGVTNPEDALDALAAAAAQEPVLALPGTAPVDVNFWLRPDGTRYLRNAQCAGFSDSAKPSGRQNYIAVMLKFSAADPFQYEGDGSFNPVTRTASDILSVGTINNAWGEAYALPVWVFTFPNAANTISLTVTNTTNGDDFTLSGTTATGANNNIITVDGLNEIVYDANGNDRADLWGDIFIRLMPGNNVMNVATAGGTVAPTSIVPSWYARWY